VLIILKSGSLNFLAPSGTVKACNGIALSFIYSECVSVALVDQHAKCILSPVVSTLSHTRHDFRQKFLNIKYVSVFSKILSEKFLTLRKSKLDVIIMYTGLTINCLFYLSDFN
jgi:hypothetical protein